MSSRRLFLIKVKVEAAVFFLLCILSLSGVFAFFVTSLHLLSVKEFRQGPGRTDVVDLQHDGAGDDQDQDAHGITHIVPGVIDRRNKDDRGVKDDCCRDQQDRGSRLPM